MNAKLSPFVINLVFMTLIFSMAVQAQDDKKIDHEIIKLCSDYRQNKLEEKLLKTLGISKNDIQKLSLFNENHQALKKNQTPPISKELAKYKSYKSLAKKKIAKREHYEDSVRLNYQQQIDQKKIFQDKIKKIEDDYNKSVSKHRFFSWSKKSFLKGGLHLNHLFSQLSLKISGSIYSSLKKSAENYERSAVTKRDDEEKKIALSYGFDSNEMDDFKKSVKEINHAIKNPPSNKKIKLLKNRYTNPHGYFNQLYGKVSISLKAPASAPASVPASAPTPPSVPAPNPVPVPIPVASTDQPEVKKSTTRQESHSSFKKGLSNLGNSCYMNAMMATWINYPLIEESDNAQLPEESFPRLWTSQANKVVKSPSREEIETMATIIDYNGQQDDPSTQILSKLIVPESSSLPIEDITYRNFDAEIPEQLRVTPDQSAPLIRSSSIEHHNFITVKPVADTLQQSLDQDVFIKNQDVSQDKEGFIVRKSRQAIISSSTKRPPQRIILKLDRFEMVGMSDSGEIIERKERKEVTPNDEIQIDFAHQSNHEQREPHTYQLVATVIHLGKTTKSGHYIARIKHNDGQYIHNDSHVSKESDLDSKDRPNISKDGYLFVYQLKQ